ncbi:MULTISPECIES: hypothetical protein [Cyanophyceae]|uniref:hypothetical protein n=1 Tax=Cyanophyceae TaxID=3028117 RepID=UPI00168271EE|nr:MULTISPECIES: hypothetical protein [Cyanophyceae]MBD1918083.1 hypothetical protein [Phormidium sp. FACHB-77]MBD2051513.1 hypothetical protein [Leptolyngbya sp. FACHB-60]
MQIEFPDHLVPTVDKSVKALSDQAFLSGEDRTVLVLLRELQQAISSGKSKEE